MPSSEIGKDKMEGINTILFDWDGTLLDSAGQAFNAFQRTLMDFGIPLETELYERIYSPNWYLMYEDLGFPREKWKEADDQWIRYYGDTRSMLVKGVEAVLNDLSFKGYSLGIVTSGDRNRVSNEIIALNLSQTFSTLICSEDVENKKPHPQGLHLAMKRLGREPRFCCYVGDCPDDIEMGKRANVLTIGIPGRYPASKKLPDSKPDLIFGSLELFVQAMDTLPQFAKSIPAEK